jgi:hypothetical protein
LGLQTARFVALLLASLGLVMGGAHVLELPARMKYDDDMYQAVTTSLYAWFGVVGGALQVSALIAAIWLAVLVRRRSSFLLTLSGVLCLAVSLGLWAALVQPVNVEWSLIPANNPSQALEAYRQCRDRWEYGHVAAFVTWLAGLISLQMSILRELRPASGPIPVWRP